MISKKYSSMLNNTSIIREFAQYASKRAAEIGAENVFNYTIGNPSVPTTDAAQYRNFDIFQCFNNIGTHSVHVRNIGIFSYIFIALVFCVSQTMGVFKRAMQ